MNIKFLKVMFVRDDLYKVFDKKTNEKFSVHAPSLWDAMVKVRDLQQKKLLTSSSQ